MSGRDRNKPCWCGSGQKYKRCHLGREAQAPASPWDLAAKARKLFARKICLHPDAGVGTCAGGVVSAHTVRRSADLRPISRAGHVYQMTGDFPMLNNTGGKIIAKLVGINEASTFYGFCQAHDTSTFAPIENRRFVSTEEQAFLLAYRPLVKELYLKENQLETIRLSREGDRGKPVLLQWMIQEQAFLMEVGINLAMRDLRQQKSIMDRDLLQCDFDHIRYVIINFDHVPDVMCSGAIQPDYSFGGKPIQYLGTGASLHWISFSLIATDTGGAAVFAWRDDSDASCSMLVDSLLRLPWLDIPHAVLRFALTNFENAFMRPDWWEQLPAKTREALESRLNDNVDPRSAIDPDRLCDDGIRAVAWKVVRIDQKRT
jgi:hypothetical protein